MPDPFILAALAATLAAFVVLILSLRRQGAFRDAAVELANAQHAEIISGHDLIVAQLDLALAELAHLKGGTGRTAADKDQAGSGGGTYTVKPLSPSKKH